MFETENHVHPDHHQSTISPSTTSVLSNGYSRPSSVSNVNGQQNGNYHHEDPPPPPPPPPLPPPAQASPTRSPTQALPKESITVIGIPSVSVGGDRLNVGDASTSSKRSYTPLKVLGDGSFGTVWLCDWHGTLPPNTPFSPMQCGSRAKPEWKGKRLVAVKRMKKKWEGGWDECKKLKELESLRVITFHPNIIPLYDFFLLPASKELYFVFESMEGNLYHLIKARKGRPLAGGLVSSIFQQVISGLNHIHISGYFHRDMKPENILVTTTGLFDYHSVSPNPNAPSHQQDVVVIIKLADFGLARETKSKPPYTEYVSTRWYRAPEVLLLSRDYSTPVDMWALGTIMAELVNLRPLFPGSGQVDQIVRICEIMGDPSDQYGVDERGKSTGGGKWSRGIKMARAAGFAFPKVPPRDFVSLFDRNVPRKLTECISDLLKYDPEARLTSKECMTHPYLLETLPKNNIPFPPGVSTAPSPVIPHKSPLRNGVQASASTPNVVLGNQHTAHPPLHTSKSAYDNVSQIRPPIQDASASHRAPFYSHEYPSHAPAAHGPNHANGHGTSHPNTNWDPMDVSPVQPSRVEEYSGPSMDVYVPPQVPEYPTRPQEPEAAQDMARNTQDVAQNQGGKLSKFGALGFGKKTSKWSLNMFGHSDKSTNHLPPVDEVSALATGSTPSLKRSQSTSTESSDGHHSLGAPLKPIDPKQARKEAERLQREAEKQRRALAAKTQREQARAVMQKRKQITRQVTSGIDLEWEFASRANVAHTTNPKKVKTSLGPTQTQSEETTTAKPADPSGNRFGSQLDVSHANEWRGRGNGRMAKARRREYDDDHSMSSSDVQSIGRMSSVSFATADSDPGPARLQTQPSLLGINRITSRTSSDEFPASARSSNSLSAEQYLAHDFHLRASVNPPPVPGSASPPPMQMLSLSPSISPSPTWMTIHSSHDTSSVCSSRGNQAYGGTLPQSRHLPLNPSGPISPYEFPGLPSSPYGPPPTPAPRSAINPIFKVPPFPVPIGEQPPVLTLPPFAELEAVADRDFSFLSPLSFQPPES